MTTPASVIDPCNDDNDDDDDECRGSEPTTFAGIGVDKRNDSDDDGDQRLQRLHGRLQAQQRELEQVQEQNAEYRDKLLKTIRDRDQSEELLKKAGDEHKRSVDEFSQRIHDVQAQLKNTHEKAAAQEKHFSAVMKEMSSKYDSSLGQLTKKSDQAEKEKNEAVVKYAIREAEIIRAKAEIERLEKALSEAQTARENCEKSQKQDNLMQLEHACNNLKVDVERLKHEKFDLENRLKIAEKQNETHGVQLTDARAQCDVLRKQLLQSKQQGNANYEQRLRDAESDLSRTRASQLEMAEKFEEASREKLDLLAKCALLKDQLSLEAERRQLCEQKVQRLCSIEQIVLCTEQQVEDAASAKIAAENECQIAIQEADDFRIQAERMLVITQQLTERNSELMSKLEFSQAKIAEMEEKQHSLANSEPIIKPVTSTKVEEDLHCNAELETCKTRLQVLNDCHSEYLRQIREELSTTKCQLETTSKNLDSTERRLAEVRNDFSAYQKKMGSCVKELRQELLTLQTSSSTSPKKMPRVTADEMADCHATPSLISSSHSRASSVVSLDRETSASREEETSTASALQRAAAVQQTMIDKIVLLQRKIARRTEKIEFLEEHVRQCLEELQKKTKIIQHFALREEASLLLPSSSCGAIEKLLETCEFVQMSEARKGTNVTLFGASFVGSEKRGAQVMCELNSRLQAVLEDAVHKNAALKNSLDALKIDNTKLSRENRLLSLAQARVQDQ